MHEPAFYQVIEQYHDQIKRFIVFTLKDHWIADDLTQETFIKAQNNIKALSDPAKLKSWLFRIAHHCCLDYLRSQPKPAFEPFESLINSNLQQKIAPVAELERAEMSACVQQKMLLLPPHYRSILWLADGGELSYAEIADILGITISNVKVRLHRARTRFKEILEIHCNLSIDERAVLVCSPRQALKSLEPI